MSHFPNIVIHGAESTAPAAAAVLADTLAISQGISNGCMVGVNIASDDGVANFEVAHRNAANNADVDVAYIDAQSTPGGWAGYFAVKPGERIVVRVGATAGTSAKVYQASLYVWKI
jgi:hypothetical protein